MACTECGKAETNSISIFGPFCSRDCADAFHQRRRQQHAELGAEPLLQAPAELTVPDFDRFALKVAVYASLSLDAVQDLPEGMRDPDILAMQVKEVLLKYLPGEYLSTWQEGSGWSRKQRYSFRKPIPMELVRVAMRDAGFEWGVAWFGSRSDRAFARSELGAQLRAVREQILRSIDEHVRVISEKERGVQSETAIHVDPAVFEPLMQHIERLDEQWRFQHRVATDGISKASHAPAREALEALDRFESSLRVLALGPADAA